MKITIFGAGYVGLVTGTCLAEMGNHVVCVDIDQAKVARLQAGECPIHEQGLAEMIRQNAEAGRLQFTTDIQRGISHGYYQFIAVGTPQADDGSADLQYVFGVAKQIGEHLEQPCIVINKSTVPVGTADQVREVIQATMDERGATVSFDVVSNPEFLREGAAVKDFMNSDRIVIGTCQQDTQDDMNVLYAPLNRNQDRIINMDIRSAELTKYAANAMLATKISFINEMSHIAEKVGADIEQVRVGMGSDPRIGYHFISPYWV